MLKLEPKFLKYQGHQQDFFYGKLKRTICWRYVRRAGLRSL